MLHRTAIIIPALVVGILFFSLRGMEGNSEQDKDIDLEAICKQNAEIYKRGDARIAYMRKLLQTDWKSPEQLETFIEAYKEKRET